MTRLDSPEAGWVDRSVELATPARVPSLAPAPDTVERGGPSAAAHIDAAPPLEPAPESPSAIDGHGDQRPWTRSGFWIIQLVVLTLYLLRLAATVALHLDDTSLVVEFSTLALFIIPVVCAALNYGCAGAVFTGGWITILSVPRFVTSLASHQHVAAWTELMQVVLLDGLALLIGQRVSAERAARRLAETSREAHLSAEAMYRDLFDSNQSPILIIDGDGIVVETNASAQRSFGRHELPSSHARPPTPTTPPAPAAPVRLVDMIGADAAARVLTQLLSWRHPTDNGDDVTSPDAERVEPLSFVIEGERVLFRPTATMLGPENGERRMQIVFENVTAETRRHDLMEAYATRVVLGQEEERRHIAQELHDGPLQTLIHLCRQIDAVEAASATDQPAEPRPPLSGLRTIVEETVAELRSIAKGLRPSILDDLGLVASISQMVAEAGERQHFVTSFGVTGAERRLPPTVELALFRIAQEALSNVERHAAARSVAVGMDFEAGGLRMLIKDDGVGFVASDRSDGVQSASMGLPGMTERAHLIGSRLVIHSEVGLGTTVDVSVPATVLDQN